MQCLLVHFNNADFCRLNTALLLEKGIPPGPLYGKIKAGEIITSSNGELVSLIDFNRIMSL